MTRWLGAGGVLFLCTLSHAIAVEAQQSEYVGRRYKLTGRWNGAVLRVSRVQQRDARKDANTGQVEGRVDSLWEDGSTLQIGPVSVIWDEQTQFNGIRPEELQMGDAVEIRGQLLTSGVLRATSIEEAPGSRQLAILGAVTEALLLNGGRVRVVILGVHAEIPAGVRTLVRGLTRDPDDRRPDEQLTLRVLGRPLIVGGEIEQQVRFETDPALATREDDRLRLEQGLQLEAFFQPTRNLSLYMEGVVSYEAELYDESGPTSVPEGRLERKESWVYLSDIFGSGFGIQLGRQRFREEREWWWDENLDAVRLRFAGQVFDAELAVAQELFVTSSGQRGIDPEDEDVRRVIGRLSWGWLPDQRLDLFGLWSVDRSAHPQIGTQVPTDREDALDADLVWLGARTSGTIAGRGGGDFGYWIDVSAVRGTEITFDLDPAGNGVSTITGRSESDVRGWAVDGGFSWRMPILTRPAITVGYAIGSADDDVTDGIDRAYRQTGLQDNNWRYHGVDRFRYYGELLRPELSNLMVGTGGLGFHLFSDSSIEMVVHRYWQVEPSSNVRATRLRVTPDGTSRSFGDELDVILGLEDWGHLEMEFVVATFRAGPAFGPDAGTISQRFGAKIDLNF